MLRVMCQLQGPLQVGGRSSREGFGAVGAVGGELLQIFQTLETLAAARLHKTSSCLHLKGLVHRVGRTKTQKESTERRKRSDSDRQLSLGLSMINATAFRKLRALHLARPALKRQPHISNSLSRRDPRFCVGLGREGVWWHKVDLVDRELLGCFDMQLFCREIYIYIFF